MVPGRRLRPIHRLVLVLVLALSWAGWSLPDPTTAAGSSLSAWTGGVNLYRDGVFTTQKSWLWCTAAGVQIVRNIVDHEADHSAAGQRRYFAWMRERNRYDLPLSAGIDPVGWTAGLRHFVDDRYRLVSSRTFSAALRSAVTRLRQTNLPVALTVSHGNHGWILTGFRATADPATTTTFTVTSVRVTGPLYGLQSKNGYDMAPNTKLTTAQFKRFLTPWRYAPRSMVWDGRYVTIQPIPTTAAAPLVRAAPTTVPLGSSAIEAADALGPFAIGASPTPATDAGAVASPIVDGSPSPAVAQASVSDASAGGVIPLIVGSLAALLVVVAVGGMIAFGRVRRRPVGSG